MGQQIGVITEIGDMGLGFEPLNEADQKKFDENLEKKDKEKSQKEDKE